ncbi:MAG: DUF58 domain-containing protein [Aureliella sp.]
MEPVQTIVDSRSASMFGRLWNRWRTKRRRDRVRALSRVRFRLTREGVHYIGILLFIFLGALLRDINLLILLAGAMIGLLLLQWRFNTRTLIGLTAQRYMPRSSFVGMETSVEMRVANPKFWLGAWLILVEEPLHKRLPNVVKLIEKGTTVVDEVPPKGARSCKYQLTFHQRGEYLIGPTTISTRFPLALGRGSRTLDNQAHITIFPKLGQLLPPARGLFQQEQQGAAKAARTVGLHEADFYGLRPWSTGDSKRWIHWRTTARLGELSVRQFERRQSHRVCVLLDLFGQPEKKYGPNEQVELCISFLSSLANHSARHGSDRLAVAVAASDSFALPSVQGSVLVENLLQRLATIDASQNPDLVKALQGLTIPLLNNPSLLVISTRSDRTEWLREQFRGQAADRLLARLQVKWLDATQADLESYFAWN